MARFVNLEVDDGAEQDPSPPLTNSDAPADASSSMTPTVCNAVTRAFQCYPYVPYPQEQPVKRKKAASNVCSIVFGIISHVDLTTLDSLARTSRMIHHGLVQYRAALIASTLRCSNEHVPVDAEETLRYRVARVGGAHMDASRHAAEPGKASLCARDMVGECRRCAAVICRVCTPYYQPPMDPDMAN